MTERRFRGPTGKLHVPRHTKGCWYGRLETCCWVCVLRHARAILRIKSHTEGAK